MAKTQAVGARPDNQLLARLPEDDYRRLLPHLRPVPMDFKQVLYEAGAPVHFAYFPNRGATSAVRVMEDGSAIEVATVGREGAVGVGVVLGLGTSPNKVVVQISGEAMRVTADALIEEAGRDGPLRRLLRLYFTAFLSQLSQGLACNGRHTVQQRCCRWLLLTQDSVQSDVLPLTHEFLAVMLGVRRASVTDVLRPLQAVGLIHNGRGKIRVLDRGGLEAAACECYRTVRDEFDRLLG